MTGGWYPEAVRRPITADKLYGPGLRPALTVWNRVNLHSTASSASSQFNYFNQSGIPDSHFHVAYDGTVEQYVPTNKQAFADLEGNDATISIETQGMHDGDEKWRPAQAAAIIKLVSWIIETHDIPRKLAETSFSGSTSSKGLSWHRLGIDGNFPSLPNVQAGRLQRGGGMHYSSSTGKICPGYLRITQIHQEIWPGVKAALGAAPTSGGFLMALSDAEQEEMLVTSRQVEIVVRRIDEHVNELITKINRIEGKVDEINARAVALITKVDRIEGKIDAL